MKDQKDWSIVDRFFHLVRFFKTAALEIIYGVKCNRIPAHKYCYPGIILALALFFKWDEWISPLFKWIGLKGLQFHLSSGFRKLGIYLSLISGWLVFGIARGIQRNFLLGKLKDAFDSCKWKCNGRYPSLIEDEEIDDHVRKFKLKTHGVTKSEFEAGIEKLEAQLNITVVRIVQEENDKSKVEIIYSLEDLDKIAHLEKPDTYVDGDLPIGLSYEGARRINIRDVAHVLVAGQTGMGKSNALKGFARILSSNNPDAEIIFFDFKGGMENADLKNHIGDLRNVTYYDGTQACIKGLAEQGIYLEGRLQYLSQCGVTNFDDYLKKRLSKKFTTENGRQVRDEKRTYLIIDEMAQLYAREPGVDKELSEKARAAVNRIARQGRAAGVHMIAATQKPDASSFDQTVKANLPGVLCFPMSTQAASVSALGTKRAFELNPNIKGRAIWKYGPKLEEVQTYLFS